VNINVKWTHVSHVFINHTHTEDSIFFLHLNILLMHCISKLNF